MILYDLGLYMSSCTYRGAVRMVWHGMFWRGMLTELQNLFKFSPGKI